MDLRPSVHVILVIPDSSPEAKWVYEPPRIGARIKDTRRRTWRVADVLQSGRRTYTVVCEPTSPGVNALPELASDLLERARKVVSLTERRRRRYLP